MVSTWDRMLLKNLLLSPHTHCVKAFQKDHIKVEEISRWTIVWWCTDAPENKKFSGLGDKVKQNVCVEAASVKMNQTKWEIYFQYLEQHYFGTRSNILKPIKLYFIVNVQIQMTFLKTWGSEQATAECVLDSQYMQKFPHAKALCCVLCISTF